MLSRHDKCLVAAEYLLNSVYRFILIYIAGSKWMREGAAANFFVVALSKRGLALGGGSAGRAGSTGSAVSMDGVNV